MTRSVSDGMLLGFTQLRQCQAILGGAWSVFASSIFAWQWTLCNGLLHDYAGRRSAFKQKKEGNPEWHRLLATPRCRYTTLCKR